MLLPCVSAALCVRTRGGESFLFDTRSGDTYEVNASAIAIIECCRQGLTVDAATARIGSTYQGDTGRIREDILRTVECFRSLGLVD